MKGYFEVKTGLNTDLKISGQKNTNQTQIWYDEFN